MTIQIYKVDKEQVTEWWLHVRPFLESALCKFGVNERFPLDCVLRDLVNGRSQLWTIASNDQITSAVVTEVEHYPLGDALIIFLMGGESMQDWGDLLHDAMVKYADEIGAKWIDTGSRRGIGKMFYDRLGYSRKYETYSFNCHQVQQ